jgi:uncharacterized membrane protein
MDIWSFVYEPRLLHGMAVHFPVALGVLGFPLLIFAAILKMRAGLRQTALAVYLLLALAALGATKTGWAIETRMADPAAADMVQTHATLAGFIWMGAMATAGFVLLSAARSEWFRAMFTMLGVIASAATAVLIVLTAVRGQSLVYDHAIRPQPVRPAAAPTPPTGDVPQMESAYPHDLPELEPVESPPPQFSAAQPAKTPDEIMAMWRSKDPELAGRSSPQARPQAPPGYLESAMEWCRKHLWPW